MKYLASTVENDRIYKIILESCKKHLENKGNKIEIKSFKYKKKISLSLLNFFLKSLISLNIFNIKKYIKLKYKNFNVGIYAASYTFKDHQVFFSSTKRTFFLIKNLLIACNQIDKSLSFVNSSAGLYVDHVGYLSGIHIQVFASYKKIVYCNGYPRGLCYVDYSLKKNFNLSSYDILKINSRDRSQKINKYIINNKYKKIIHSPKKNLKWMKYTKYSKSKKNKIFNKDLSDVDYLIYAHSFIDGQLFYGYDEFVNLFDWLEFTIKFLKKRNKKIIVKSHPNFHNKIFGKTAELDKKIFFKLKNKYENKNIIFIDIPLENKKILKSVNKKTILVSHHGTAILEGTFLGYKTICSQFTMWAKEFKISNQWNNLDSYKKVLKKDYNNLKNYKNSNDFFQMSKKLFFNPYAHGGEKNFISIIEKYSKKINWKKIFTSPNELLNQIKNDNQYYKIINRISKNIETI